MKALCATALATVLLGGLIACYATDAPPAPCVNVENCGNPADLPPLTDDSPINLTGMGRKSKPTTGGCKDGRSWPDGSPPDDYCQTVPPAPWRNDEGARK